MEIVNFPPHYNQIGAKGDCPHCSHRSYFGPVGGMYSEQQLPYTNLWKACNAAQCQGCKQFILVVGERNTAAGMDFTLKAVYPLGKPNENVDPSVPEEIRSDFQEALRCQWIKAYRATVVMCRRAIQSVAVSLGAKGTKLNEQIDNLATEGRITGALKDFSTEIRLTGNLGAHPDKDGLKDVTQKDADDIVEFTREFLHHIYVMPAKLSARRSIKPPLEGQP